MNLDSLRLQINSLDNDILRLFEQRMKVCKDVAQYKIENNLPVFQNAREQQVIERISSMTTDELKNSSALLFTTIMDISKCLQYQKFFADNTEISANDFDNTKALKIACPGTSGSYSEQAGNQIFENGNIVFYKTFDEVFKSVSNDECDFGIVPIQNSSAGSVTQTYNLLKEYNLHIAASTKVKISHCLAAKETTDISQIKNVYSHEQAISQCSDFISKNGFNAVSYLNTALAAELVANSDEPIAAICSEDCAALHNLKIIERSIANCEDNYTRFILISKDIYTSKNANIISVSLSLPHTSSALYRMLTKFSVAGLNLLRIESRPIASKDFDVLFYLDFEGRIDNKEVQILISELSDEMNEFHFLGNYEEI